MAASRSETQAARAEMHPETQALVAAALRAVSLFYGISRDAGRGGGLGMCIVIDDYLADRCAQLLVEALEKFGKKVRDCYLVVVENKAPYPVSVLRFTEKALDLGDRSCIVWNERRRLHEEANSYPSYVQSIVDLDVPDTDDIDSLGLAFADEEDAA